VDGVRAIVFDGACLRGKCEEDKTLGYDLMLRFARVMNGRLQNSRARLLDVYGTAGVS
jgi:CRP/FNR family cyclic AMP-dependent transcriptional regulator